MINIITGTPGAGKTFLALKLLTEKYFYWHNKDKTFYRKKDKKKYTIFTNIDELKLEHKNFIEIFKENNLTFETFFTVPYQEKLHQKYPHIIYIIDECQQFIPYNFKNKDVIYYFDYHRHFGDSIQLITQDYTKICKAINVLSEIEYRAVKSTFSIFGEFRYNIKSSGDIFKRKTCKKDQRIFDLYKSFSGDDQEKQSNPIKTIIILLLIAFPIALYIFWNQLMPSDERIAASKLPPKQAQPKTAFTNEQKTNKKSYRKDIDLTESDYQNEIQAIPIESFLLRHDKLWAWVCPIRNIPVFAHENIYPIKKIQKSFYILLTLAQYDKLANIHSHITPG